MGITDVSRPSATTQWVDVAPAAGHEFYDTIAVAADNTFYSLAMESSAQQGYDLVHWGLNMEPKVVATFGNAHPVPLFGWIGATVNCQGNVLVSATVEDHFPGLTKDV